MESAHTTARTEHVPITFRIAKWYGFIFAIFYLLYGGVSIILGVLDRNYDNMSQPFIFLLAGVVFISFAFAFVEGKKWGWFGLVTLNCLTVLGSLFSLGHVESYVLIALSFGALAALFAPATRKYFP